MQTDLTVNRRKLCCIEPVISDPQIPEPEQVEDSRQGSVARPLEGFGHLTTHMAYEHHRIHLLRIFVGSRNGNMDI